ncbi:hypothetical protein Undi14_13030 [Undibacterium sp. 14-3-2]|uniref:hypothetical protein n=1 Tax=Undibacterium sp. 14-3-2 TaxID=2800129 RepID=UPI0019050268|nr:hypothetical protein [Undibacterium sp. 14-3-2]MBK1890958.1 hypothetical protein [Undibacterium sp. 14-3-2]
MSQNEEKKICGIVMPISTLDGCSEGHWSDVLEIITEAIEESGFEGNLVSNADDVGIIQKRIIQNLYENPIVVCDVSGKNPNVMFELGMRLAFDKPTIIIKDDKTSYSFDTSPIEHIEYPRDLRFSRIVDFKLKLAEKIKATYEKSTTDTTYTTFLKHFGEFKVAKIDKKEVSGQEFILDELKNIRMGMRRLERNNQFNKDLLRYRDAFEYPTSDEDMDYCLSDFSSSEIKKAIDVVSGHPAVLSVEFMELEPDHKHLRLRLRDLKSKDEIEMLLRKISPKGQRNRHVDIRKNV